MDALLCEEAKATGIPQFHSNPRDCRSYFLCVGETSVPLICSPEQHFHSEFNWCDSPAIANCTSVLPPDMPEIPDDVRRNFMICIRLPLIIFGRLKFSTIAFLKIKVTDLES